MYGDLESDGSGNIYINSRVSDRDNLYRMTPDWNTTLIASFERPQKGYTDYIVSPNGRVAMIQDDILYKVPSGQSRVEVADLPGDSYRDNPPGLAVLVDNGTVYVAQNIWEDGGSKGYITAVSSTGEMTREIISSPRGGDSNARRMIVGADNSVYISGYGYFGSVNSDATMTVLMSNMDVREYEIDAVGSDGAFYDISSLVFDDGDWSVNRYDRSTLTPKKYYPIEHIASL